MSEFFPCLRLFFDNEALGSGERLVIVLHEEKRRARVFYPPLLKASWAPLDSLKRARAMPVKRSRLRRRIIETRRLRKRLGLVWNKAATKAALELLGHGDA
jgi:hypothetical protein